MRDVPLALRRTPAAAWLLALTLLTAGGCGEEARQRGPGLLSDHAGPISEWILFVPEYERALFHPTQAALIDAASDTGRFRLVHASAGARYALESRLRGRGFERWDRLEWVAWDAAVPPWARDHFLLGEDALRRPVYYLLHPAHYPSLQLERDASSWASLSIAMRLGGDRAQVTQARLEGGSIVTNAHHAFLPRSCLDLAVMARDFGNREAVRHYLEGLYGRTVVDLETPFDAPGSHCDLFMAPLSGQRVVLGDPLLAAELLQGLSPAEQHAFEVRVRTLSQRAAGSGRATGTSLGAVVTTLLRESTAAPVVGTFRRLRARLTDLGYEVVSVPWLSGNPVTRAMPPVLSYTNVILEDRATGSVAYVPTYGLPALDDAATAVWERLGFTVRPIPALGPALRGGALRCLTQTLRSPL